MCELPCAAIVSNRCWSVMMNKMSGRLIYHSERSEEYSYFKSRGHSLNVSALDAFGIDWSSTSMEAAGFFTPLHMNAIDEVIFMTSRFHFPSGDEMPRHIWPKFFRSLPSADVG